MSSLTRRELEIARLVSEGLTDREIATKLFLARRTVEWHLEQIRNKLGFSGRAQIGAFVAREDSRPGASRPTAGARPNHNLPAQTTAFVGRKGELVKIRRLLFSYRLLTLTGVPGVGKTRLALEAGAAAVADNPDGAWFIDLSPVRDAGLVARTVCKVIGAPQRPGQPDVETLTEGLHDKRLLLIVDNCEHLIEACLELVSSILRACPDVTLLATSREALGAEEEVESLVPPLTVPDLEGVLEPARVSASEAVQLFVDRARRNLPEFEVDADNGATLATLCKRLDGLPLAIELAAGRTKVLSPEQILARLNDRFRLLAGGKRSAPERHHSLRAAIEWSHSLLARNEQILFRRLSVFAGSFDVEAVEGICAGEEIDRDDVADLLSMLVDKSLLLPYAGLPPRWRMLESLRDYAWKQLLTAGEAEQMRRAHAAFYLQLGETTPRSRLEVLEVGLPDLRAAMEWSRSNAPVVRLRMATSLAWFFTASGRLREGMESIEQALAASPARDVHHAAGLFELGWFHWWGLQYGSPDPLDAYSKAAAAFRESMAIAEQAGDAALYRKALNGVAAAGLGTMLYEGSPASADYLALLDQCLQVARAAGDRAAEAQALHYLGVVRTAEDRTGEAMEVFIESLAIRRDLGLVGDVGYSLLWLSLASMRAGELGESASYAVGAGAAFREAHDQASFLLVIDALARLAWRRGQRQEAARLRAAVTALGKARSGFAGRVRYWTARSWIDEPEVLEAMAMADPIGAAMSAEEAFEYGKATAAAGLVTSLSPPGPPG